MPRVTMSPDGKLLVIGLSDGRLAVVDVAQARILRTWQAHVTPVGGVARDGMSRDSGAANVGDGGYCVD